MPSPHNALLVRSALLLALALVFQSLRFILPVPPPAAIFLIGTLVNTILAISTFSVGLRPALFISFVAPLIAFLQGQLPLVIFIPVVSAGNMIYCLVLFAMKNGCPYLVSALAALAKTATLTGGLWLCLQLFELSPAIAKVMSFALGWPQLVTGAAGAFIAFSILPRLKIKD